MDDVHLLRLFQLKDMKMIFPLFTWNHIIINDILGGNSVVKPGNDTVVNPLYKVIGHPMVLAKVTLLYPVTLLQAKVLMK